MPILMIIALLQAREIISKNLLSLDQIDFELENIEADVL
jgi:hypothetical protein